MPTARTRTVSGLPNPALAPHLEAWRVLTKLRTDPARATKLLRALLVLTNLELER